jgi:hypothetical protein
MSRLGLSLGIAIYVYWEQAQTKREHINEQNGMLSCLAV